MPRPALLPFLLALVCAPCFRSFADAPEPPDSELAVRRPALAAGRTDALGPAGWLSAARQSALASEYEFTFEQPAGCSAPNRAHGLRATVGRAGVRIAPRNSDGLAGPTPGLTLAAAPGIDYGAGDRRFAGGGSDIASNGAVETIVDCLGPVARRSSGALTESVANGPEGVVYRFELAALPGAAFDRPDPASGDDASEEPDERVETIPISLIVIEPAGGAAGEPGASDAEIFLRGAGGSRGVRLRLAGSTDGSDRPLAGRVRGSESLWEIAVALEPDSILPIAVTLVLDAPGWAEEGSAGGAQFGWSVSSAGDVNGDGFDDIIVGAPGFDRGQTDEGRIFVYLGSPDGVAGDAAWTAESNQAIAQLGISVAGAGDLNGDGFDDIAAGANLYDGLFVNEGAVFVWLGSAGGLGPPGKPGNADRALMGGQPGGQLGHAVAHGGDVDADGFDDLVAGAWVRDAADALGASLPDAGAVLLYRGSASGPAIAPDWIATGVQPGGYFGFSIGSAGDVDGDGYGDLVVGAPFEGTFLPAEGAVRLFRGGPAGLEAFPAWTVTGGQSYAQLGYAVAGAGDVDGDGFDDLAAGARGYDNGQQNEGRVLVYAGGPAGPSADAVWAAESDSPYALLGYSVAAAGDVNADGFADLVVGADGFSGAFLSEGRAYLYLGSPGGLEPQPAWTVAGGQADAFLGRSVCGAGDVNGDGLADLLVGADGFDGRYANQGRALLFPGAR